jgi:hypothetical protein
LDVLGLADAQQLELLGVFPIPGDDNPPDVIAGACVAGTVALVWMKTGRLFVVDLRDPGHRSGWPGYGSGDLLNVVDVQVAGGYAYLATKPGGLEILNVAERGTRGDRQPRAPPMGAGP